MERKGTWTEDNERQFRQMLRSLNPDPIDAISIHAYGKDTERIAWAVRAAKSMKKPLFIGEFGVPGTGPEVEQEFHRMLRIIEESFVLLAAVWVFDRSVDDYNITATKERSWMLRDLLPDTFTSWSRGWGTNEVAGPDCMNVAAQYIFGAPRPGVAVASHSGRWLTNTFSLEAVVRTNDPCWRIFGESSAALHVGSWTTNEISWQSSTNQSDVLPGTERRVLTVRTGTNSKKFLRINAQNP
jgi:hypothetical protein